jgi:hypothetical protein
MFIGSRCVDVEVALEVIKVPLGENGKGIVWVSL